MNEPDPTALIPDYQRLMLPVLRAADHGEVRIGDVIERLARLMIRHNVGCPL